MGLNIGVYVQQQEEAFMSYGNNPKGSIDEINAEFDAFLREKFPEGAVSPSVERYPVNGKQRYTFDVRLPYSWNNYDSTPMYLAILEYVLLHFSGDYGIDLHIYKSP